MYESLSIVELCMADENTSRVQLQQPVIRHLLLVQKCRENLSFLVDQIMIHCQCLVLCIVDSAILIVVLSAGEQNLHSVCLCVGTCCTCKLFNAISTLLCIHGLIRA